MTSEAKVSLEKITKENLSKILALRVTDGQTAFVADNATSIAEAYFTEQAWFRAVFADGIPVGFVMLYMDKNKSEYYVWRFMIDRKHQRNGHGFKAMKMVIDYVKELPNAKELSISYVPSEGNPSPFYRKLGFKDTGEVVHGENVMKLSY